MEEEKSKSQKKRDASALQALGIKLSKLKKSQLEQIPVPDSLLEAIDQLKKIKDNGSKKRYAQFIGRLMRNIEDVKPIQNAYDRVIKGSEANMSLLHLAKQWSERLIEGDSQVLTDFITEYPSNNIQQLRQLIRQAKLDLDQQKNSDSIKALLQLIKEIIS